MKLTRNRVFGSIGVLWGGGVAISGLFRTFSGNGAYAKGQVAGLLLGALMFAVGLYYAIKG
jgi:hypothetical protein